MNRRGVVEVMVIIYIAVAFIIGIFAYKPAVALLGGTAKKTSQSVIKKEEKLPVMYYTDEKGNKYIAYAYKTESSNINISETPKQTIWQKILNLGFWGILLVVLGCLFPPVGAILMFLWKKITGALHTQIDTLVVRQEELSEDAKKIVQSVDEGLAVFDMAIAAAKDIPDRYTIMVTLKKDFLSAMSRRQDATTKLLVATLKND